ncbi:unnamed protein product [Dibothriocephalus latus]|uniref:Ig-like domain-containing protein n=1 Tax=Dibothriocephalus latus TaxID=60516 RepID=A0A3P7M827_DIBLA|nr:unnamed protein product [Dibothriocephalus latus]
MQGDPDNGEHDLVITGVTREDAGSFECQVSPTADQPPLRRSTNLSVLGKLINLAYAHSISLESSSGKE